jgi:hypothetical protein
MCSDPGAQVSRICYRWNLPAPEPSEFTYQGLCLFPHFIMADRTLRSTYVYSNRSPTSPYEGIFLLILSMNPLFPFASVCPLSGFTSALLLLACCKAKPLFLASIGTNSNELRHYVCLRSVEAHHFHSGRICNGS